MSHHPDDTVYAVLKYPGLQEFLNTLSDSFGNQDQACKNGEICWINDKTATQLFNAPGFENFYLDEPVPTWITDIVGPDLLHVSVENIRILIRHPNFQPDIPAGATA